MMEQLFNNDFAEEILSQKRNQLGRGLCYTEKILFLHEARKTPATALRRGKDQIVLRPDRVAMQDATAQMAMLQFIQTGFNMTYVPATIHCDHLIVARQGADSDLKEAIKENREIYDFLSSSARKYGIGFWGPGTGIIHQVVFENYALPGGLMIGADSHTANAGGLGMLAAGVGGSEAAAVMAGLAWEVLYPPIVGVRLTGRLTGWASAKDVILELLKRFTVKRGAGKIFEFYGDGALTLSATQKATIANMGTELGATASVFVYDDTMDAYLRNVGRQQDADRVRNFAAILNQDKICLNEPEKVFDEVVQIDLRTLEPSYAGPFTPDRIIRVKNFRNLILSEGWPQEVSSVLIGSCTNSSYSDLYECAHVLDQAAKHGLKAKVPLMLSPGSQRIYETIKRDGVLNKIINAGAIVLSPSCGPCIGQWDRRDSSSGRQNIIFTTFNRNFRARNDANPETMAFITSPQVAAALAVAGDARFNPDTDTLTGKDGVVFKFVPPTVPSLPEEGLAEAKELPISPATDLKKAKIKIKANSKRIELLKPFEKWDRNDFINLPVLVKTFGQTTTDHISPGGRWLQYRGHLPNISDNLLQGAVNAFTGEVGHGTNVLTGERGVKFSVLAKTYKQNAGGFVIIGDENYGEGSSREHAAMTPRFLGAKVIIARSFARIHEANLKRHGILPLTFMHYTDYDIIEEYDRLSFIHLSQLKPGSKVTCIVKKKDGRTLTLMLCHTLTEEHIKWFKAGSAINTVRIGT